MKKPILIHPAVWIYFLVGIPFSISVQAANLTKEETVNYINDKVFDCEVIIVGENTMGINSYYDLDVSLVSTTLSVQYKKDIKTDFGISLHSGYTDKIEMRSVSNIEIRETGADWCDVSLRINCRAGKCANTHEVSSEFGASSRTSPAIVLDFDVRDVRDAERLRKAFEHLKTIVIEESPSLNESDPFD